MPVSLLMTFFANLACKGLHNLSQVLCYALSGSEQE
jgi:hypothetical protein